MHLSILFCLVAAVAALPQSRKYGAPPVGGGIGQTGISLSGAAAAHFGQGATGFGQRATGLGQGATGFGQGATGFGQGATGFGQGAATFGQGATGFGQGAASFGQGASHSIGSGIGAIDVRGGDSSFDQDHEDDDDDDDDNDQFVRDGFGGGPSTASAGFSSGPSIASSRFGGGLSQAACGSGLVRHADGSCVQPELVRNIFLYNAPQLPVRRHEQIAIPTPKLFHNIVFVRTPEFQGALEPVIVPPPQQKTLVYVLTKEQVAGGQRIIEVPATPDTPEVFYINVEEGENPQLPIGIDLRSALAAAASQQGQLIQGLGAGAGGIGLGGGASRGTGLGAGAGGVGLGAGAGGIGFGAGSGAAGLGAGAGVAGHGAASGSLLSIRGDDDHDDSEESFGGAAIGGGAAGHSQDGGYSLPQPVLPQPSPVYGPP